MLPEISSISKKKALRFSNPLTGKIYSNQNFLKNMQIESSIEPIPEQSNALSNKHIKNRKKHKKLTQTIDIHDFQSEKPKIGNTSKYTENVEKVSNQKKIGRVLMGKELKKEFQFSNVRVIWLDLMELGDVQLTHFEINFGEYFRVMTNKKLEGPNTQEFIIMAEKLIKLYLQGNHQNISLEQYSNTQFTLTTKQQFMKLISELQKKNSHDNIMALTKYYLIPFPEIRKGSLKDITLNLTKIMYKKYNLKYTPEYKALIDESQLFYLISEKGEIINDFCELSLGTKNLFIMNRRNILKNKHKQFIKNYYLIKRRNLQQENKNKFTQGLKMDFRRFITKGQYDESLKNYDPDFGNLLQRRRINAENLVKQHRNTSHGSSKYMGTESSQRFFRNVTKISEMSPQERRNKSLMGSIRTTTNKSMIQRLESLNEAQPEADGASFMNSLSSLKKSVLKSKLATKSKISKLAISNSNSKPIAPQFLIEIPLKKLAKNIGQLQLNHLLDIMKITVNQSQEQFIRISDNEQAVLYFLSEYLFKFLKPNLMTQLSYEEFQRILEFILGQNPSQEMQGEGRKERELIVEMLWTWFQGNNYLVYKGDNLMNSITTRSIEDTQPEAILLRETFMNNYDKHRNLYIMLLNMIFGQYERSMLEIMYEILMDNNN